MKVFYLAFITIVFLESCSFGGGPCNYKDIKFKATIISIEKDAGRPVYGSEPVNESIYTVRLVSDIDDPDLLYKKDTLYLDAMTRQNITESFLAKHKLSEGSILEGTAHLITSGSCPPGQYQFDDSTLNSERNNH